MDTVGKLLALVLALFAMVSIAIWAGDFNDALDLFGQSAYAGRYPGGSEWGPVLTGLGALAMAYGVHSMSSGDGDDRR